MNILVISDQPSKSLYDYFEPSKLDGVDLVLSCGDLPPQYLSLLATYTHAPVLYVHGNHDLCYEQTPPDGCICIDNRVYVHEGVRILGINGCHKYTQNNKFHHTQKEMYLIVASLWPKIWRRGGIDILLTHSPAYGLGDDTDLPHMGFKAFLRILGRFKPKYFIHGHVHLSYGKIPRVRQYRSTTVINGFEEYRFEYETGKRL